MDIIGELLINIIIYLGFRFIIVFLKFLTYYLQFEIRRNIDKFHNTSGKNGKIKSKMALIKNIRAI